MRLGRALLMAVLLAACGGGPEADAPSTTADPGLPSGNTRLAEVDENWFDVATSGADIPTTNFDCDAIRATYVDKLVLCGVGGSTDAPFMVAMIEEYVSTEEERVSTTVNFMLYEPVMDSSGQVTRATVIGSDTRTFETAALDATEFRLLSAPTVRGSSLALHALVFGGSRTWHEIAMIGTNQFGSAQVVATFDGEGAAIYQDGHGFVISNYHYAHDDAMCCASYWAANYFRPGPEGWTHTKQTIESDPNKDLDEEQPFMGFREPLLIGTYELPRPEFDQ